MLYNNKIIVMNINELIAIVKNKLEAEINIQDLKIEDKSFLHKNHKGHQEGKFHLKLIINSDELAQLNKVMPQLKEFIIVLHIRIKRKYTFNSNTN